MREREDAYHLDDYCPDVEDDRFQEDNVCEREEMLITLMLFILMMKMMIAFKRKREKMIIILERDNDH